jgi:adenylate cyclase
MAVHLDLRNAIRTHMLQSRAFHRFVPTEFLDLLGRKDVTEVEHGDSSRLMMSVLFSDIRAFSSLSEELSVDDNFRFLNGYLNRMVPGIQQHGGFVDKFIGDAIMALFPSRSQEPGTGTPPSTSADSALRAALGMRMVLREFNASRALKGYRSIDFGIGINTGELMIGTVGSQHRLDTTVIGDTVNLASRLQSLTTLYNVPILISDHTLRGLSDPDAIACREVDSVTVKGKKVPVVIYEVYESDEERVKEIKDKSRADFTRGLILYKSREFQEAHDVFKAIVAEYPEDHVAQLYVKRCEEYIKYPPADNWEGVVELQHK